MRLVLVALAVIGVAGVVVGTVAHLAVLLGGTLAWMGPVAPRLTTLAFVCFGLLAVIQWLTRDWVWPDRRSASWWPWPARAKWFCWGYVAYTLVQWVRGGGYIVFGRGAGRGGGGLAWPASPLANTAFWMFAYGVILVSSMHFLTARDDTGLDTPGDSFPRA